MKCSLACTVFLGKCKLCYIYIPGFITCHFQYLTESCGCPRILYFSAVKNVDICLGYFIQSWILIQFLQIWLQFNNSRPEWSEWPTIIDLLKDKFPPEISSAGRMKLLAFSLSQLETTSIFIALSRKKKKKSESSTIFNYFCSMVLLFIRIKFIISILKWEINKKIIHYSFYVTEMCEGLSGTPPAFAWKPLYLVHFILIPILSRNSCCN